LGVRFLHEVLGDIDSYQETETESESDAMRDQNFEVTVLRENGQPYKETEINGAPGFIAEIGQEFKVKVVIHNAALLAPYAHGKGCYNVSLEVDGKDVGYSWYLGHSFPTYTFAGFRENHVDVRAFRLSQPSLSDICTGDQISAKVGSIHVEVWAQRLVAGGYEVEKGQFTAPTKVCRIY
jgi:hypothetical protein